jgi:HSP20 family protein
MRTMLPSLIMRDSPLLRDFEQLFGDLQPWQADAGSDLMSLVPHMDVAETSQGIEVTLEVPGMNEDDLDVQVQGKTLTLRGEKRRMETKGNEASGERDVTPQAKGKVAKSPEQSTDNNQDRTTWHITERRYGRFSRTLTLPFAPEADKVQATFKNGLLQVTVPRPENDATQVKRIAVKGA